MTAIGIDFGTTNSVAACLVGQSTQVLSLDRPLPEWEPYGFDQVFPSVMSKGEAGLQFGWAAKQARSGRFDAVKRLFATQLDFALDEAGDALAVEEVATRLFAENRQRVVATGIDPTAAVITVPANSKGRARHRTKICAGMAGFEVLGLINEPTAAAMAYAQRHPEARQLLVFDWGGGTLDVTVLHATEGVFIEQASSGLPTMGGLDFDSRLAKLIRSRIGIHEVWTEEQKNDFRLQVELAKIRLSSSEDTVVRVPSGAAVTITRSEYEREIRGLIDESRIPLERVLGDIGAGPGSFDAVVLVGGTCRIPAVRGFVRDLLRIDPDVSVNPMTAVAEGAAIAAAILSGTTDMYDFFVSTEHALGTFAVNPRTSSLEFSTIIPRNHKLPAQAQESYSPVHENQESVEIEVVEGDPDSADPDFTVLKSWKVPLDQEDGSRVDSFMLRYEWDVSGILHVSAVDEASGTTILEDDISYGIAEDKKKLAQIASRARKAVTSGVLSQESVASIDDAEAADLVAKALTKVVPFLDGDESENLLSLVRRVETADGTELANAKVDLRRALAEYSYLL